MDYLHSAFLPILRAALASLELPQTGIALDLASGAGNKLALLREALGEHMQLLALDIDQQALVLSKKAFPFEAVKHIVADAHTLPLDSTSMDTVFCIAAFGLFHDQRQVLAELRRILKPGAGLLLSLTEMRWCERIAWPSDLLNSLAAAYQPSTKSWQHSLPASVDISSDYAALLLHAGFSHIHIRAFMLEDSLPQHAELALLAWQSLRPVVAPQLSQPELMRCDACAAAPELELCPVVLLANAH